VTQSIIAGHRWKPQLVGVQTSGKLGNSSGDDTRRAFEEVMNTVIREYRQKELKVLNRILQYTGLFEGVTAAIKTSSPVSFSGVLDINAITTVDEGRKQIGLPELNDDRFISNVSGGMTPIDEPENPEDDGDND